MGGLRVEPDMIISEVPSTADAVIVVGAGGLMRTLSAEDSQQLASILGDFRMRANRLVVSATARISWLLLACSMGAGTPPNSFEDIKDLSAYTNPHQYVNTTREAVRDKNLVTASGGRIR